MQYPFSSILCRPASVITVVRVPERCERLAADRTSDVGQVFPVRYLDEYGYVDIIGDGSHVVNWHQLERWTRTTMDFFQSLDIEAQVEFYVVDEEDDDYVQYGSILEDEEGRRQVEFTYGGPRHLHIHVPLSDYLLT